MSVETDIQDGIYSSLSNLLAKADTYQKASGFVASYFQQKMNEGVIDVYDYNIKDCGVDGFHAEVEFLFAWKVHTYCKMLVIPSTSPGKAFDRAMGILG